MSDVRILRPVLRWRRIDLNGRTATQACAEIMPEFRRLSGIREAVLEADNILRVQYALDEICLATIHDWLREHGVDLLLPRYYAFAREAVFRVEAEVQARLADLDGGRSTTLPIRTGVSQTPCVALQRFDPPRSFSWDVSCGGTALLS